MTTRMEPEQAPFVIGIDPSITGTCVCLGTSPKNYRIQKFDSASEGRTVRQQMGRYEGTIFRIMEFIEASPELKEHPYPLVLMEGYANGAKFNREVLGEFCGLLKWHLVDDYDPHTVQPTSLKKYITSGGGGKKCPMIAHIASKYGVVFPTDDHYDAYGLFLMALGAVKAVSVTKEQQSAIDAVLKNV